MRLCNSVEVLCILAWANYFSVFLILGQLEVGSSEYEPSKTGIKMGRAPFVTWRASAAKALFLFYFTLWLIPKGLRQEAAVTRVHRRFCTVHPDITDCQVEWEAKGVRVVSDIHWVSCTGDLNNSPLWIARRLLSLVMAFTFHRVGMRRQLS